METKGPGNGKPKRLMPEEANRLLLHAIEEPPVAHAYHHWDDEKRILTYSYNNRRIVSIEIPEAGGRVSFRHGSDGTLQSRPLVQQVYVILEAPATSRVAFQMSGDTVNVRPHRAKPEHAIVGQVGRPLLAGVNGLYDINQDLLVPGTAATGAGWTNGSRSTPMAIVLGRWRSSLGRRCGLSRSSRSITARTSITSTTTRGSGARSLGRLRVGVRGRPIGAT